MAISGPIALYSNVPIEPQYYQPSRFQISNITLGVTTIVTSINDINYVIGQEVKVLVPQGYGCQQINGIAGYVLSLPASNQCEISINSASFDPFLPISLPQVPQIIPIGNIANGQINLTNKMMTPYTPGAFINISPN